MSAGPMGVPLFLPGGGGGAPPPPPAGATRFIIPNEAAFAGLTTLVDGDEIFVLTHHSQWIAQPAGKTPLAPHQCLATGTAGINAARSTYSDPLWREGITDVYWDPGNVTGIADDENAAFFQAPQVGNARQPVLTAQELFRRMGSHNPVSTGDLVGLVWTLHILSKQPIAGSGSDPLVLDWINGVDSYPRIVGEAATVALGPAALTVFTPQNLSVPAPGGTPCSIQIGATVWAPFVGKRIRRISDGSVAYIIKDSGGGGVARISQPQLTNEATFDQSPTNVNWAAGDMVVVEDLTDVNFGHVYQGFEGSALGFAGQINVLDVNIAVDVSGAQVFDPVVDDINGVLLVYQSTCDRTMSQDPSMTLNGCGCRAGYVGSGQCEGAMFGGAVITPPAGFGFVEVFGASKQFFNFGVLDFFTYVQGGFGVLVRGWGTCGVFSIWDAAVSAPLNPGGHALIVGGGPNTSAGACAFALRGSLPVWGSGSVGKGIRIASSSRVTYQNVPNVTGATGDFELADAVLGQWGDLATGVYQPPGGAVLSWAALAAAKGIAGFGGSAHNIDQDAHINKAAAT